MKKTFFYLFILLLFSNFTAQAQKIKPGDVRAKFQELVNSGKVLQEYSTLVAGITEQGARQEVWVDDPDQTEIPSKMGETKSYFVWDSGDLYFQVDSQDSTGQHYLWSGITPKYVLVSTPRKAIKAKKQEAQKILILAMDALIKIESSPAWNLTKPGKFSSARERYTYIAQTCFNKETGSIILDTPSNQDAVISWGPKSISMQIDRGREIATYTAWESDTSVTFYTKPTEANPNSGFWFPSISEDTSHTVFGGLWGTMQKAGCKYDFE